MSYGTDPHSTPNPVVIHDADIQRVQRFHLVIALSPTVPTSADGNDLVAVAQLARQTLGTTWSRLRNTQPISILLFDKVIERCGNLEGFIDHAFDAKEKLILLDELSDPCSKLCLVAFNLTASEILMKLNEKSVPEVQREYQSQLNTFDEDEQRFIDMVFTGIWPFLEGAQPQLLSATRHIDPFGGAPFTASELDLQLSAHLGTPSNTFPPPSPNLSLSSEFGQLVISTGHEQSSLAQPRVTLSPVYPLGYNNAHYRASTPSACSDSGFQGSQEPHPSPVAPGSPLIDPFSDGDVASVTEYTDGPFSSMLSPPTLHSPAVQISDSTVPEQYPAGRDIDLMSHVAAAPRKLTTTDSLNSLLQLFDRQLSRLPVAPNETNKMMERLAPLEAHLQGDARCLNALSVAKKNLSGGCFKEMEKFREFLLSVVVCAHSDRLISIELGY